MIRPLRLTLALVTMLLVVHPARTEPGAWEILAAQRANNRTANFTFRLAAHQAHLSEVCIRFGSLPVTLVAMEIEFADGGGQQRVLIDDTLAPGARSRPVPVDSRRAVSRVFVTKRPGLRAGETVMQLLGRVER